MSEEIEKKEDLEERDLIKELLAENQKLLVENNVLLKKLHKQSVLSLWFRVIWFLILIGAPFIVYYYVIEPYFTSLGSSFEVFKAGLQEVPGWKQFYGTVIGGPGGK